MSRLQLGNSHISTSRQCSDGIPFQVSHTQICRHKNLDMPRQLTSNHYRPIQSKLQNRPLARNLFHNPSQNLLKHQRYPSKLTTESDIETLRKQPPSLYQQILKLHQHSSQKKHPLENQLVTEATFKPHLKNQIHSKLQSNIRKLFKQKLKIISVQKKSDNKKSLFKLKQPQTKYEKILCQYFGPNNQKKESIPKGVLYKTFQKNPTINTQKNNQSPNKVKNQKPIISICESKYMKRSQSEGWMSMNFYQRQERILKTRKEKEKLGRKENIEKQIQKCTFKPQINKYNRCNTLQNKDSYLATYNKKIKKSLF